jgi:hypothetical protein
MLLQVTRDYLVTPEVMERLQDALVTSVEDVISDNLPDNLAIEDITDESLKELRSAIVQGVRKAYPNYFAD